MKFLFKRISVKPNYLGYLYRKNRFSQLLEPGIYHFLDLGSDLEVILLPTTTRLLNVVNQEVLTQDSIALRFSYIVEYRITDGSRFLSTFDAFQNTYPLYEAEQVIRSLSQVCVRKMVAEIDSEAVNTQRDNLLATVPVELRDRLTNSGIELQQLILRDLTFPKSIQDLFARQLEAKLRARADLDNARTVVATARTLKNAADLMKENENIQFLQWLETITKIAAQGKHTFVLGDWKPTSLVSPSIP